MLAIPYPQSVWLYRYPTDMRKSFDGLCGLVINEMGKDPIYDGMFAFINKRKDRIKILIWDRHGYWLLYKRLEKGCIQSPAHNSKDGVISISIHDLAMLIDGIDLKTIKRKKRFILPDT